MQKIQMPERLIQKNKLPLFALFFSCTVFSQSFSPPAGQPGTTAMYKDSSAFVAWASGCRVTRGYEDLSNPSQGFASVGDSSMATGKAQTNAVVSLGDGGSAVCIFPKGISNGPGVDFAVFENSIDDTFLELAFVEVSSDGGTSFHRFPSRSLTDTSTQTNGFGTTDATKINNLAGKYRAGYGTPFDLQELANIPSLNINAITHVRIVDVVGSINPLYATRDSQNNKVNDPWPTPFASSGFDLDAVGVIHESAVTGIYKNEEVVSLSFYPNPAKVFQRIFVNAAVPLTAMELLDVNGKVIARSETMELLVPETSAGFYFLKLYCEQGPVLRKIIIQ
jgi:hypothetical protein